MDYKFTREDFEKQVKILQTAAIVGPLIMVYVHPVWLKYPPKVKYLRRYYRQGERMKKKGKR